MEFKFSYNNYDDDDDNNNNNNTFIRIMNRIVLLWLDASLVKRKDTRSLIKISQSLPSVNKYFTLGDVK